MNAAEMLLELTDRLGITGTIQTATSDRLYRAINRGKDRLVAAYKWPWLETSTSQLFTSGTRTYNLTTEAKSIVSIEGSTGFPVRKVERDTYDEIHRSDTSTAGLPTVYTQQGYSSGGRIEINVWPNPSANSTGTLRYIGTVLDTTGSNSWNFVPPTHHKAILAAAEAEYCSKYGLDGKVQMTEAKYQDEVQRILGWNVGPVARDGSEQ